MKKLFALASLLAAGASAVGCAMCCAPYDDAYNAYGGKWQRGDMYHGRVGSAFHPAEAMGGGSQVIYEGGPMAQSDETIIHEGTYEGDSYPYYDEGGESYQGTPTPAAPPSGRMNPFQEEARTKSPTRR